MFIILVEYTIHCIYDSDVGLQIVCERPGLKC